MLSQVITYQWLTNWLHKSVIKRFQFSGFPCLVLYYLMYSIWILLLIFLSKMEKKNPSLSNLKSKWENLSLGFTFLQGNRWFIYRIARITLFNAQMVRIKITTTDYFHPWDWETGMIPWMLYTFYKSLFFFRIYCNKSKDLRLTNWALFFFCCCCHCRWCWSEFSPAGWLL